MRCGMSVRTTDDGPQTHQRPESPRSGCYILQICRKRLPNSSIVFDNEHCFDRCRIFSLLFEGYALHVLLLNLSVYTKIWVSWVSRKKRLKSFMRHGRPSNLLHTSQQ